jgi:hypothetical protein
MCTHMQMHNRNIISITSSIHIYTIYAAHCNSPFFYKDNDHQKTVCPTILNLLEESFH